MFFISPKVDSTRSTPLPARTVLRATALGLGLTLVACQTPSKEGGKADGGKAADADAGEAADEGKAADATGGNDTSAEGPKLGKFVEDGPVPWTQLLRKSPEEVEKLVGEPKDSGEGRITCVRFVPERVMFECEEEIRLYDLEGFETLAIEYEDGKAANVSVVGFQNAEQEVSAANALALVGLELPVNGKMREVDGEATLWEWFNSLARLKIDDDQFMVRLSTVEKDWARTKLEVIVNSPLTEDEKSRIKATGAAANPDAGSAGGAQGDPSKPETVLQPVD